MIKNIGDEKSFFFSVLGLSAMSCSLREGSAREMLHASFVKVDTLTCNLGKLSSGVHNVPRTLAFYNSSADTLWISSVPVLCNCLSIKPFKGIILPKRKFYLNVIFHPSNKKGFVSRKITIIFNDGKYFITPTIHGIVI